jgi:hypothetical protein
MTADAAETSALAVSPAEAERHKFHGWEQYPDTCRICKFTHDEDVKAREAEHDAEIDRLTCNLVDQVGSAAIHVTQAQVVIGMLISDGVYDIEFAEGDDGPDAIAELMTAARALRNVERIAIRRREILLAADRPADGAAAE